MTHHSTLFHCYYFPFSIILFFGSLGIVSSFLIFSRTELSDLFFIESWSEFFIQQPLATWLIITFITIMCIFLSKAQLIITQDEIYIESFSIRLMTLVERSQVQRLQLYHHGKSKNKLLKPLKQNTSFEDLRQTSTLGISLKPEYRKEYRMPSINLKQVPKQQRLEFINILSNHWGLNADNISGFDDLVALKLKHKLR